MSAAKRLKTSPPTEEEGNPLIESQQSPAQKPQILVDLGNGVCGQLRTEGSGDEIVEGRWRRFKEELHQSEFWLQCKERSEGADNKTSKDVTKREIQRGWERSGKGISSRMLDTDTCIDVKKGSEDESEELVEKALDSEAAGEQMAHTVMAQTGFLQRYLVTIEYSGTRFLGWQKQKYRPDIRTVQGTLEEAFNKFIGSPVICGGSSRTDTGVHALGNVCHIDAQRLNKKKPGEFLPPHSPDVVQRAVNHFLQKDHGGDLMVVNVRTVPLDFHARYQATERTYHYRIVDGNPFPSIFERDRAWNCHETLDLAAMQEAALELVGDHDFSSFRGHGCQAKTAFKTLNELHICEMPGWPVFPTLEERVPYPGLNETEGDLDPMNMELTRSTTHGVQKDIMQVKPGRPRCFVITARARSFLYHQVRLIVGTLKAAGCGMLTRADVRRILDAKDIKEAAAMAPAHGLYLAQVKYDFENPRKRPNWGKVQDVDEAEDPSPAVDAHP